MPPSATSTEPAGRSSAAVSTRLRQRREGHGKRFCEAFDAAGSFPALAEPCDRLASLACDGSASTAELAAVIESDVALCVAVLRHASEHERRGVQDVATAVSAITPRAIQALASRSQSFDFFEHTSTWGSMPERFRLHALATQNAAGRVAVEVDYVHRGRLAVSSLLHDVGKLVLCQLYPGYVEDFGEDSGTALQRIQRERREFGLDHAVLGGALIRRWGLPKCLAVAVERHHDPAASGEPAIIRLADMLAHYEQGAPVSQHELLESAAALGLGPAQLRRLIYELPSASNRRQYPSDPCPLSGQQLRVLQRLGRRMVCEEIADELGLASSTVRSHLHHIYRRLGVVDRAQAVILATDRGWI
jgi:HD-like signal output (HDOD) protein/DNA-binding CsgD family transcriptional regulator